MSGCLHEWVWMRNGIRAEIAESGEHSDPSGCRENSPA
ncbi:MAG: hypothetical protein ACJASK_001337, partial [Ilumatobacter sp.]